MKWINKNKGTLIILIISIGLGVLISTMMKSNLETYAPVTLLHLENTEKEIQATIKEVNELEKIVENKQEELKSLMDLLSNEESIVDKLNENLMSNKTISGHLALEGPGIIIKMYDNQDEEIIGQDVNDDVIHDVDVLNILNDLRLAGAEAISINGERVITSSEIKCRGPVIGINGRVVGTPFIISAIGDPTLLMAAVNAPYTYGDILKNFSIGFEPEERDEVYIPAYSGNFDFKYAKPIREGDK